MKKLLLLLLITLSLQTTEAEKISNANISESEETFNVKEITQKQKSKEKNWTFMVYITSNNNLYEFARPNVQQMEKVGSNDKLNIVVQQDILNQGKAERLFVKKRRSKVIETVINKPESISGTPESLFSFAKWAIEKYPAKKYALILWDHGSGVIDPSIWKVSNKFIPFNLYIFNETTGMYELNRNEIKKRGICFNDVFEIYLKNQDLKEVLSKISSQLLNNQKLNLLGMDACNMAMLEIGTQIKNFVNIMVGSEETEPGTGWNYHPILKPLKKQDLTEQELGIQIVDSYQAYYEKRFTDFTQSAVDLKQINDLEKLINIISEELIKVLNSKNKTDFFKTIKKIRTSRITSTIFANIDYIDLKHFLKSLKVTINKKILLDNYKNSKLNLDKISIAADIAISKIKEMVIKKTYCKTTPKASGISFYFPTRRIHNSYYKTDFALTNKWIEFLQAYIKNK